MRPDPPDVAVERNLETLRAHTSPYHHATKRDKTMSVHCEARPVFGTSRCQRACFGRAQAMLAAAEYDLPGDWEQPDFEDDNDDEADEEDEASSPSLEHNRLR